MPRVYWQEARRRQRDAAVCVAPREVACRRPSLRCSATFPPVQARWEGRVPAARVLAGELERCSRNSRPISVPGRTPRPLRARALEQFLRLKLNLHRSRHVSLSVWLNHRKEPPFILHRSGKTEIRAHQILALSPRVCQRAPTWDELLARFLVPEIELERAARTEVIRGPCLSSLTLTTDPAP